MVTSAWKEGCQILSITVLGISSIITLFVWITASTNPLAIDDWGKTGPTNTTTLPDKHTCDEDSWPAGSAFFTLAALVFGYISHPRGSLLFTRSGRIWRLCPVFALCDTVLAWYRILEALSSDSRPRYTVVCSAIMAVRAGQSWGARRSWSLLRLRARGAGETDEADVDEERDGIPLEEFNLWVSDRENFDDLALLDRLISIQLETVRSYEHGLSYRFFIWVPMVLQAIKIGTVSGRGAILTQTYAWVYFWSWLSIELFLLGIPRKPLNRSENQQAVHLCRDWMVSDLNRSLRKWGPPRQEEETPAFDIVQASNKFNRAIERNSWQRQKLRDIHPIAIFATMGVYIYNFALILIAQNAYGSNFDNSTHITILRGMCFFLVGWTTCFPVPIWLATWIIRIIWYLLIRRCMPAHLRQGLQRFSEWFERGLWLDPDSMWQSPLTLHEGVMFVPSYMAACNFMLLFLYHLGVGPGQPFDCLETRKPAYYDWLG